ncbi:MAG: branched-chain amino acid ABC transporter permease [Clostridiales bacterium]|jgi:branched-chain amino acid transport system permease protein|nr:branched-chain amino acid ABC transporter permease [Clostridiales bacterium]
MKKQTKRILNICIIALAIVFLYWLNANTSKQGMLVAILQKSAILAIAAVSMNLLNGFTGLFSLGQAGFMSIGAYVTSILVIPAENLNGIYYMTGVNQGLLNFRMAMANCPPWVQSFFPFLAILAGGLAAALFAALIGMPVLRLKSDYLAIATLGFSEIIRAVFSSPQMDSITNGSYGLKSVPNFPEMAGGLIPSLVTPFLIAAICILLMVLLINSSYGRAFKSIREDEIAAEAMGVNLLKHKELAFTASSFFTAVAGGLLAMYMRSIEAKTFSIALTYDILLIVVIGGIGSVSGSILSAFLVTAGKEWWLRFFDTPLYIGTWQAPLFRTGFRMVIFSILLMVVVLFYRRGLMGTNEFSWQGIMRFPQWFRRKFLKRKGAPPKGGDDT